MENPYIVGLIVTGLILLIVWGLTRKPKDPPSGDRREPPGGGQ